MLGESAKTRKCMFCSKELSLLQRVRRQRFCCEKHHRAYLAKSEQLAFEELVRSPVDEKPVETEPPAVPTSDPAASQRSLANLERNVDNSGEERPAPAKAVQPMKPSGSPDIHRHVLDHLPGGIAVFKDPNTAVYCNEPYRRIWFETGGEEPKRVLRAVGKAFQDGLPEREFRIVLRPGKGGTVRIKLIRLPAIDSGDQQLMVFATRALPAAALAVPMKNPRKALATVA